MRIPNCPAVVYFLKKPNKYHKETELYKDATDAINSDK